MLATVATEMPRGDRWVFEPKYDGIRILAVVSNGEVRLLSRNAIDRTGDFPGVAQAVGTLATRVRLTDLMLDGELVARTAGGIGRFADLQQRSKTITAARHAARGPGAGVVRPARMPPATGVTLMVFDLLVAGPDVLLDAPWRRAA